MITKRTQKEVTAYLAETYNQKPYEWLTDNRFVDHHGCDGYVFKSELAARRYILGDIHEKGCECEGAMSDADWICLLIATGMRKHDATRIVNEGMWEKVARKMLDCYGPSYFLSTYSGSVSVMSDSCLLYY